MSEPHQMPYAEAANLYEKLEARAATRRHALGLGSTRRIHISPRRLVYSLMACSCAAVTVIIAAAVFSGVSGHPSPTSGGTGAFGRSGPSIILGREPVPIGSNPLPGGRSVSLSQAARLLGANVPTPNTRLANPSNLSVVWGIRGEVMLDYVASQIRISIEPANRILRHDAYGAFQRMARDDHMFPGAMTINGDPAIVVGGSPHHHGFAQVVHNGLSIVVMGQRSAAQLIDIARSLSNTKTGD